MICYRAEGGPKVFTREGAGDRCACPLLRRWRRMQKLSGERSLPVKLPNIVNMEVCIGAVPVDKLHQMYLEAGFHVGDRAELLSGWAV